MPNPITKALNPGTDLQDTVGQSPAFQKSLGTINSLLDPNQNRVSVLPRLQQERDILTAEQQKKDAFRGDFARAGLQKSGALTAIEEAIGATSDLQTAQAGFEEAQTQEVRDRAALGAYVDLILNPTIDAASLDAQEVALRAQLSELRKQRSFNKKIGIIKVIGGIVGSFFTGGATAPVALQGLQDIRNG